MDKEKKKGEGGTGRETVLSESRWLRAFTERFMDITKGLEVIDGRKRSRKNIKKMGRTGRGTVLSGSRWLWVYLEKFVDVTKGWHVVSG